MGSTARRGAIGSSTARGSRLSARPTPCSLESAQAIGDEGVEQHLVRGLGVVGTLLPTLVRGSTYAEVRGDLHLR